MQEVQNKTAFITGGASGIGLGIAHAFVDAGMQVVLADLRQDHIDTAAEAFARRGQSTRVHLIRLDVTDRAAMSAAADETRHRFGKIHVLVNNAGVGIEGPFKAATYADWDFALAVNLGGVVNGLQTFLPRLREHGEGGHIVNTASLAGLVTMPASFALYATAKAAVIALSESIRTELAQDNIGVSVLCPGPVKSNIHELDKNRPARFATNAAFEAAAKALSQRPRSELWMEPTAVGALVLDAVKRNALYVITHGEWRPAVAARTEAILAAMPEKIDPRILESLRPPSRSSAP
jgi:NAD(P)-dependent dehydrogenase (short-subunit alcohol dehydrogenase family)